MSLLLVLPHGDFTLSPAAPEGFEVLDPGRDFLKRVLEPKALLESSSQLALALPEAGEHGPFRLLQLRTAKALLRRMLTEGTDTARGLRCLGAALPGLSARAHVRLALDDIQLASGTTERSRDAIDASEREDLPYRQELAAAAERCRHAERVRLWLECDQQLPAVFFLARALEGKPLELCGRFARLHRQALARLEVLRACRFVEPGPEPLPRLIGAPGFPVGPPLGWRDTEDTALPATGPWAGRVTLAELLSPELLVGSHCRLALLPFAAVDDTGILGTDGAKRSCAEVEQAVAHLRAKGLRILGEWWIGAPGVDAAALARSTSYLEHFSPFDRMAALRHFHWPAAQANPQWGHLTVQLGEPDADRDLARTRPFAAPGTLSAAERGQQLQGLFERLRQRTPLVPGRVAQAYVVQDAPPAPRGERLKLDPDCAVVTLPVTLEGAPVSTPYAANLRTGSVMKLDARLAPAMMVLERATLPAQAFKGLPEAQTANLVKALIAKSILQEVV